MISENGHRTLAAWKKAAVSNSRRLGEMMDHARNLLSLLELFPAELRSQFIGTAEQEATIRAVRAALRKEESYDKTGAAGAAKTKGKPRAEWGKGNSQIAPHGYRWAWDVHGRRKIQPDAEARRWAKLIIQYQEAGWNPYQIWTLFVESKVPRWLYITGKTGPQDVGWRDSRDIVYTAARERKLQQLEAEGKEPYCEQWGSWTGDREPKEADGAKEV